MLAEPAVLASAPVESAPRACPWLRGLLAALLSGGLATAAFASAPLHLLAWIAFVPFASMLPRISARQAWVCGTVLALVYYRIGLNWLITIAGPVAAAAIVVYAVWMGLAFALVRMLIGRFGPTALLWALPLAFTGQEILRSEGLPRLRFPYMALGYSQPPDSAIVHATAIGGVYVVSLLLIAVNGAIAFALIRRTRASWSTVVAAGATAGLVAMAGAMTHVETGRPINVAAIQAETLGYRQMAALVEEAAGDPMKPEFIVLPEHTIGDMATERHPFVRSLSDIARRHAIHICVGAHVPSAPGSSCDYDNIGLLIGPDGRMIFMQPKAVPLPFFQDGEPARSLHTFDTPATRLGIYVCYDGDFTDVPRRYADLGAEIMLVPVMNPMQWPVRQRNQQAAMARFRSLETARPSVRGASSGTSMIVDYDGRIVGQREQKEGPGYICGQIHAGLSRTGFVRGGHLVARAIVWLFLLGIVIVPTLSRLRRDRIGQRPDAPLAPPP